MGKRYDLTEMEQGEIIAYRDAGLSYRVISQRMGIDKTTAMKFMKRYNSNKVNDRKGNCGRHEILDMRYKHHIWRTASNSMTSSSQIKRELDVPASTRTIRRVINNNPDISYEKKVKSSWSTEEIVQKRFNWATEHLNWSNEWKRVIYVDEKRWNMDGPDNTMYYHDKRKPKLVKNVRQGGGKSIMVWIAFTFDAKLPLAEMIGSQNAAAYQKMLKNHLLPFIEDNEDVGYMFLQDGASIHRAISTKRWFEEENIEVVPWPSYSPDMNPTEHVHSLLTNMVYAEGKQYYDLETLRSAVLKAWEDIDQNQLNNLVESMSSRVRELWEARGGTTHY
jgi:transposase